MSQRAAHDSFIPFDSDPPPSGAAAGSGGQPPPPPPLQAEPRSEVKPEFTPLQPRASVPGHGQGAAGSRQPVVTLQRDGDRVTGIRIECSCGQVIDLACSYDQSPLAP